MSFKKTNQVIISIAAICALSATTTFAHTPYIKPSSFLPKTGKTITFESALTETFSNPDVAVKSDDWHFYTPNGVRQTLGNLHSFKQVSVFEQVIAEEGTYRFSTGERKGRKEEMLKLKDGSFMRYGSRKIKKTRTKPIIPEGAVVVRTASISVSDVYITNGKSTSQVLKARMGRLAIIPVTHPNEIHTKKGFKFRLMFDGKPLKNQKMKLFRDGGVYADDEGIMKFETGRKAVTKIDLTQPGLYLLSTRHTANAPKGSDAEVYKYTATLTFEVRNGGE